MLNKIFGSNPLIKINGSKRLLGFDKPTIWSIMTPLAIKTNSINLVPAYEI
jgi:hypothetical protein